MAMPREVVIAQRLVQTYKSASSRSKEFNLSMDYLFNIMAQDTCAYSGEKFHKEPGDHQMTLERFNNKIGYVEGNVIPVKLKYNRLRANHEIEDLIRLQETTAARIVARVDAKKDVAPVVKEKPIQDVHRIDLPGFEDINLIYVPKTQREEIRRIVQNIKSRQAHILQKDVTKEHKKSLEVRIHGGITRIKAIIKQKYKAPQVVTSRAASKKTSKAENTSYDYGIIIQGLNRFQNLSRLDKAKLKKGLPLSATFFQLLRGKM